jgi:hypothetical protein
MTIQLVGASPAALILHCTQEMDVKLDPAARVEIFTSCRPVRNFFTPVMISQQNQHQTH